MKNFRNTMYGENGRMVIKSQARMGNMRTSGDSMRGIRNILIL